MRKTGGWVLCMPLWTRPWLEKKKNKKYSLERERALLGGGGGGGRSFRMGQAGGRVLPRRRKAPVPFLLENPTDLNATVPHPTPSGLSSTPSWVGGWTAPGAA